MKVYKANKKGLMRYILIGLFLLPVGVMFFDTDVFVERPVVLIPLLAPIGFALWIYFDTYYTIEKGKLKYKSAFLKGEIDIQSIHEILQGKTLWAGVRPALSRKGMIIKYNKFDEVYIAPESNQELISDLLKINGNIKLSE